MGILKILLYLVGLVGLVLTAYATYCAYFKNLGEKAFESYKKNLFVLPGATAKGWAIQFKIVMPLVLLVMIIFMVMLPNIVQKLDSDMGKIGQQAVE